MIIFHDDTLTDTTGREYPGWVVHRDGEQVAHISQDQVTGRWGIVSNGEQLGSSSDPEGAKELAEKLLARLPDPEESPFYWATIDARTIGCNHRDAGCVGLIRDRGGDQWEAFDDEHKSLGQCAGKLKAGALVTEHATRVAIKRLLEEESEENMAQDTSKLPTFDPADDPEPATATQQADTRPKRPRKPRADKGQPRTRKPAKPNGASPLADALVKLERIAALDAEAARIDAERCALLREIGEEAMAQIRALVG